MKLALINPGASFGGAEGNLRAIVENMTRNGIPCAPIMLPRGSAVAERFQAAGIPVRPFRFSRKHLRARPERLALWLRRQGADLLHINHHWDLDLSLRLATCAGLPAVIHMRGVEPHSWVQAHRAAFERASLIVAVAGAVGDRLVEGGVSGSKVRVVYDGINVEPFEAAARHPPATDGQLQLGFVGRLAPEKGLIDLLEAMPIVRAALPGARLRIVGTGAEEFVQILREQIAHLGLSSCVELAGFRRDVPQVLAELRLLVLPTFDRERGRQEACPNVLLEAMAAGVPLVATSSGGVVELLAEGRGRLVAGGNPAELAAGIVETLRLSPAALRERLQAASTYVRRQHTIAAQVAELCHVYSDVTL